MLFSRKKETQYKRRDPRVKLANLVRMTPAPGAKPVVCNLVDLSASGVCFRWDRAFKPGAILNIVINLTEEQSEIPATIKVVWRAAVGFWGGYRMGAKIVTVAERHRDLIRNFVLANPLQYA